LAEPLVSCAVAQEWGKYPSGTCYPDLSEPVTQGQEDCIKMDEHERLKFGTLMFLNLKPYLCK
jgi:hypothetical protein